MIYIEGDVTNRYASDLLPTEKFGKILTFRPIPVPVSTIANPAKTVFSSVSPYAGEVRISADGKTVIEGTQLATERRPELVPFPKEPPSPASSAPVQQASVGGFRTRDLWAAGIAVVTVAIIVAVAKGVEG